MGGIIPGTREWRKATKHRPGREAWMHYEGGAGGFGVPDILPILLFRLNIFALLLLLSIILPG